MLLWVYNFGREGGGGGGRAGLLARVERSDMWCWVMTAASCLVAQAFLVPRWSEDSNPTFLQFGNGLTFLRKSYRVKGRQYRGIAKVKR